jgi:hypothetical protein
MPRRQAGPLRRAGRGTSAGRRGRGGYDLAVQDDLLAVELLGQRGAERLELAEEAVALGLEDPIRSTLLPLLQPCAHHHEPSVVCGRDPVDPFVRRDSVAAHCCTCQGTAANLANLERGVRNVRTKELVGVLFTHYHC